MLELSKLIAGIAFIAFFVVCGLYIDTLIESMFKGGKDD